jgi:hypothetical protein
MSSDQGQPHESADHETSAAKKRSRTDSLKFRPGEIKVIVAIATIVGFVSAVASLVGLKAHGFIAVLTWSVAIVIVVILAVVAVMRGIRHQVKLPILIVIVGLIAAVLVGGAVGNVIRTSGDNSTGRTHQASPPHQSPSSSASPSTPPGGSPSATPSQTAPTSSPPPTRGVMGTIAMPDNGADVTAQQMLSSSGTIRHLQPGYRIDLFLKFAGLDVYYAAGDPNSVLKLSGTTWSGSIFVGRAAPCTLYLVDLSPSSVRLMNSETSYQSNGYPSITALGKILASVSFTST